MCGIVSIHSSGMPLQNYEGVLEDMMKTLHHRGPDGEGRVHIQSQVLMGHRRLSVIDLENGKQPMISKDGRYSLIFNGEIYNYLELREELISQGVAFHTISDTEVLLNMLVQYDTDAIGKLNGMFS